MEIKRKITVAVGVVINPDQKILIAKRADCADQGGLWEFPGGKVEAGENIFSALCRELNEEVGIKILSANPFIVVDHEYESYHVTLHTWLVDNFTGKPYGALEQELKWVSVQDLKEYSFPLANNAIIEKLTKQNLLYGFDLYSTAG